MAHSSRALSGPDRQDGGTSSAPAWTVPGFSTTHRKGRRPTAGRRTWCSHATVTVRTGWVKNPSSLAYAMRCDSPFSAVPTASAGLSLVVALPIDPGSGLGAARACQRAVGQAQDVYRVTAKVRHVQVMGITCNGRREVETPPQHLDPAGGCCSCDRQARGDQKVPDWRERCTRSRPKVERKIAHTWSASPGAAVRPVRAASTLERALTDVVTRAAVVNLARLSVLGFRWDGRAWAQAGP
jgi:hypothetical protein